jgi:hypothetical protein
MSTSGKVAKSYIGRIRGVNPGRLIQDYLKRNRIFAPELRTNGAETSWLFGLRGRVPDLPHSSYFPREQEKQGNPVFPLN